MDKTKTFSEYLVEKEYFSQEEFDALNENLKTELSEEEEAKVDKAIDEFVKEYLEKNKGNFTIQSYGKGKYGRVLAEIFIDGEEKSLNQLLIENGHAYIYEGGKKQVFNG